MLPRLEVVESIVRAFPEMRRALGSHGIPLVELAKAGGEAAKGVVAFLEGA